MALQKQSIPINFTQGLDQKSDDKQVPIGKFLALTNSVFTKQGLFKKRNGFPLITSLPNADQSTLTTLNDNLLATGSNLYAFSQDTGGWLNQGTVQPVSLSVQPLVRVSTSQTSPDTAVASTGLTCLVYMDNGVAYYQISDSVTGQQIVTRTSLGSTATNPRAFILGRYFIITFMQSVGGSTHLRYIAVPISMPGSPHTVADLSTQVNSINSGYDGVVVNNSLYVGWEGDSSNVKLRYLTSFLLLSPTVNISSSTASLVSMTADSTGTTPNIWISFWDSGSTDGYAALFDSNLNPILTKTQIITTTTITEITSAAQNGLLTVLYENLNTYGVGPQSATKTDFISKVTLTSSGTKVGPTVILRSVGLASKAFISPSGTIYLVAVYGELNQPTYFLIDSNGNIFMRLAATNGGGYEASQVLPSVSFVNNNYYTPYLIKDFLASVNKGTQLPSGTPVNGIYTQTGINLVKFSINTSGQQSSEIAGALHLTGGQLWEYDGVRPVEHGFQVYPENIGGTTATGSGGLTAQLYYYVFTYEWTDNQGNLHRSAPSIPYGITTTTGSSTNTLYVPTLRLTYKVQPNPVRIVGYRWSVAQQTYYQFTSITSPVINNPSVDYVTITDTLADSAILGQPLLYTTGGIIENIAAPGFVDTALFKNRLFGIDAEDPNLLWYSKQVIQNTPVEMSDLLTLYVAPTSGAQGSTGSMRALSAMDDKLIIFKKDAIYYMTGTGPDNTGAQNDFSDPIFITAAVGTANPNSIVLMPNGLMFQSDKGIWLLGRDLSTNYIGAPVENYNNQTVMSAQSIPGTNQVRFILDNNITLMYDYYYNQWGTHSNVFAIFSTLYQGAQTYLNSYGDVYQEAEGTYKDGATPVLLSLTTSWINAAGIQGYERFYQMYLLGTYITPFKLSVSLAYDYNPSAVQMTTILPDNYAAPYGGEAQWGGGGPWGGPGNIFEARLFPERQKCETFQLTIQEIYDPSLGIAAGEGLTLSGISLVIGMKRGWRTNKASQSFG